MTKKDLFYKDVEQKLDSLKQGQPKKEKASLGEKLNKAFVIALGLVILIGLIFTLIGALRR
ncbi:accessory Sec system protein Asp4 [Streptococcus panodentis]|uniref:Accessory secretory protein Asp4 n=1 Tax=Streptococcus panodentis TaxID=1581472 RepID=A0ABS5AX66_9STRE|nr:MULTISPECIES: accessory secretory system protein Asp4 [Streptococcus]KXT79297.1 accessory secretory protein Asp4 [Streptococcus sp. DD11]MBP2621167.1 Accessory secretory protein Asp4 [Streptococcus panodentis]